MHACLHLCFLPYFFFVLILLLHVLCDRWLTIYLLLGFDIFTDNRITPYAAMLTCYVTSICMFALAFGFVINRSEYYGLPMMLLNSGLGVGGAYVANDHNISIGLKLFLSFLSPQIGLTVGIFGIETYIFHHGDAPMDWSFVDTRKNLPDLKTLNGVLIASAIFYFLINVGMPFDWIFRKPTLAQALVEGKEDMEYPCDHEEKESGAVDSGAGAVLNVDSLSHIYPDGTHAVKNVSFRVASGEVLSFLGANGAGLTSPSA